MAEVIPLKKSSRLAVEVAALLSGPPTDEKLLVNAALHAPAPLPAPSHTIVDLKVSELDESKTNPRKTFVGIEELARSMKVAGVIVPLIVRASGSRFEIVAGHRRFRAAKKAGLERLPCDVRSIDDTQMLELQILENAKREDLSDLEHAESFEALQQVHGYSVEQIAEKFSISMGTVYSRLKLLALCAEARTALAEGTLPASVAVPLARIPTHTLQARALKEVRGKFEHDGTIAAREATVWIQKEFCRSLKNAPFKLGDVMLIEEAGACTGCPHNTATATPGLFEDFAKGTGQTCTKISCFKDKADAAWKAQVADAKASGAEVLDRDEGAKLYQHGTLPHGSKYVELDSPNHADRNKQSWREFFERLPEDQRPTLVVAPDRDLKRHDLCDATALVKAIAASPGAPKWSKAEEKAKEERQAARVESKEARAETELRERAGVAALKKIAAGLKKLDDSTLRFILLGLADRWVPQSIYVALELEDRTAFEKAVAKGDTTWLHGALLIYGAFNGEIMTDGDGHSEELKRLTKAHGVDLKAIEKAIVDGDAAEKLKTDADEVFTKKKPAKKAS